MKLSNAIILSGIVLMLAGCSNDASNNTADGGTDDDAAVSDGTVVVDGPNGYTLEVEEFGELADWSYQSTNVLAKLCGRLEADRTLRIYRATISPTQEVLCAQSGAFEDSILNFEAGRELEQPSEDGSVVITDGVVGTKVSGGESFGKSGMGTIGVEIKNEGDLTILPATLYIQMTTNTGQLKFTFSGEPF